MTDTVLGCDISLNHGGVVELVDGVPGWHAFYTDVAYSAERGKDRATRITPPTSVKSRQDRQMMRLAAIYDWFSNVLDERKPDYVGIEDYAIRVEQGAHYMGEVGGIARYLVWERGIPLRLHDPISVKMFAALDGTAQKDAVERAVAERFPGLPFDSYNAPKPPKAAKQNRQTSEDLCDALSVAELVWTEVQLRSGALTMAQLGHAKRVQVFNRVTKTYPSSLLDREFIRAPFRIKPSLRVRLASRIKELTDVGAVRAAELLRKVENGD